MLRNKYEFVTQSVGQNEKKYLYFKFKIYSQIGNFNQKNIILWNLDFDIQSLHLQ